MPGPMDGIKVVEIGVWVAGPATGAILADWGAEVIKIEPPGVGDPGRLFGKMLGADLPFNPVFENDNRGKRGIVLDLSSHEGKEIALELIDGADVFVSNVRPAALARLGLDPATLLERNSRLVYGLITGYGLEGPDADRPAYDIAGFWSRSGVAAALTKPGDSPPFQRGGMGDHCAGVSLAAAISAALYSREKTGKGQLVSTSLLRQGVYFLSFDLAVCLRFGLNIQLGDRKTMFNPVINNYQDSEGKWFWIVGLEAQRHWPHLARAVGRPEWIEDARFADPGRSGRQCRRADRHAGRDLRHEDAGAVGRDLRRAGRAVVGPGADHGRGAGRSPGAGRGQLRRGAGWSEHDAVARHAGGLRGHAVGAALHGAGAGPAQPRNPA